jgi:hypothetical protein
MPHIRISKPIEKAEFKISCQVVTGCPFPTTHWIGYEFFWLDGRPRFKIMEQACTLHKDCEPTDLLLHSLVVQTERLVEVPENLAEHPEDRDLC